MTTATGRPAGDPVVTPLGELPARPVAGAILYTEAGAGAPRRDAVFHLNGGELRKAVAGGGLAPLHSGGTPTDPIQLVPGQAGSYILYTDPARGLYLEPV